MEVPIHGSGDEKAGGIGVFSGNWGGHWSDRQLDQHMMDDIKSCPATILTIQEAEQDLLDHLKEPPEAQPPRGSGSQSTARAPSQFFGIRGPEPPNVHSVMICARKTLVQALRLLLFHNRHDGPYRVKKPVAKRKEGDVPKEKNGAK